MSVKITSELMTTYGVGPLLYMPALRSDICEKLISCGSMGLRSAAICLEDTVRDDLVHTAEVNLCGQLKRLSELVPQKLPMIFIRVRRAEQIGRLSEMLGSLISFVSGFILPKIDDESISSYIDEFLRCGRVRYIMPIIENPSLLRPDTRCTKLARLYDRLMGVRSSVLNVRVGGNDFSNTMAMRTNISQTIYDLPPVAALLSDIAAVFASNFAVSAPVWNYFDNGSGDDRWRVGMLKEIEGDKCMGFVGKTVIHPCQIGVVNYAWQVSPDDYADAQRILSSDGEIQVLKSADGSRMYENKVHSRWAEKTLALAKAYGIRSEE